jgi:hypothetical protein
MDKRTAEALELSIAHWERNVAAETLEEVRIGSVACALCRMFLSSDGCEGCPVEASTGESNCDMSPYRDALRALETWRVARSDKRFVLWRAAAQRELDFLKGLRDEAEK